MKQILIYGFGFIGKNNYAFLSQFKELKVFAYDDLLSSLNPQSPLIKSYKKRKFDLVLVSIANKNAFDCIKKSLSEHFSQDIIKFAPIFYESPSDTYLSFLKENFDISLLFDFDLEAINKALEKSKKHYYNFRAKIDKKRLALRTKFDEKYANLDIFQKLHKTSQNNPSFFLNYPGFCVPYNPNSDPRNYGFIDKIDFKALKNRNKKLCLVFGNSFVRCEHAIGQGITDFIKQKRKGLLVLNLGLSGSLLYEQLLLYNALFYALKPEYVLSFFGGVDYIQARFGDKILLKKHSIFYMCDYLEGAIKENYKSALPLYSDFALSLGYVPKCDASIIIEALNERIRQFSDTVSANGGKFLAFIQPILSQKSALDSNERKLSKDKAYNAIKDDMRIFISRLKASKSCIDTNHLINIKERCFDDMWLHCTPLANKKAADFTLKYLD